MTHKLYQELGLNIRENPSSEDIKRAYKKKAIECHPDKNKNDPNAEEKFKKISNAYEILSDEQKRRAYDHLGDEEYKKRGGGEQHAGGFPDVDIFERFFNMSHGHGRGGFGGSFGGFRDDGERMEKCKTYQRQYQISLEDAFKGLNKTFTISLTKHCHKCQTSCSNCNGSGVTKQIKSMGVFTQIFTGACDKCEGQGQVSRPSSSCSECNGQTKYKKEITANLSLPAGVTSGYKTMFQEMGEQAKTSNQKSGDLIMEIQIAEHPVFSRQGNDLYYKCNLTYIESVIGKEITIPYFGGDITININDFGIVYPGQKYKIDGKGMPIMNTPRFGNMYLEFVITYPKIKNKEKIPELKALLESMLEP